MKKVVSIFISTLLFSSNLYAANWYRVELVVFEQLNPDTGGEVWDTDVQLPDLERSVELIGDIPGDEEGLIAFQNLSGSQKRLSGIYSALKVSRQYRPILHTAWQQPAMGGRNARSVHIKAGDELETKVDGSVRIRSSLYLHVDVDLVYFINAFSNAGTGVGSANQFTRLLETRKIKLNEIHYFDHPLFGVLLRVGRL